MDDDDAASASHWPSHRIAHILIYSSSGENVTCSSWVNDFSGVFVTPQTKASAVSGYLAGRSRSSRRSSSVVYRYCIFLSLSFAEAAPLRSSRDESVPSPTDDVTARGPQSDQLRLRHDGPTCSAHVLRATGGKTRCCL